MKLSIFYDLGAEVLHNVACILGTYLILATIGLFVFINDIKVKVK